MQFIKRINVLLGILMFLELIAYGYFIYTCGVFGYVFGALFLSFFATLNQAIATVAEKKIENIYPIWFGMLKKSKQIHFGLVLVIWVQGWAWANWTWRSLLVATIAYLVVQHLFTNAIRNERDRE
jgi:hypothetical protein